MTGEEFLTQLTVLDAQREELDCARGALLTQRGWEPTSNTPGAVPMWRKQLPDNSRVIMEMPRAIYCETMAACMGED